MSGPIPLAQNKPSLHKEPLTQKLEIPGIVRYPAHTPRPGSNGASPPQPASPSVPPPVKPPSVPPPPANDGGADAPSSSKQRKQREAHSAERKAQALALVSRGLSHAEVGRRMGIPASAISNWASGKGLRSPKMKGAASPVAAPKSEPAPPSRGNPLARFDAVFSAMQASVEAQTHAMKQMQASLDAQTKALRDVDEIRTALRVVFGG